MESRPRSSLRRPLCFQAVTIRRSSSAQGGAGPYEVITIDDEDVPSTNAKPSRAAGASHLDSQSASRMECLARGGGSALQRDFLLRGGTQTLGGSVKVESVMALRSTPQWLSATSVSIPPPRLPPLPQPTGSHPFSCSSPGSSGPHQTLVLAVPDRRPSPAQREDPALRRGSAPGDRPGPLPPVSEDPLHPEAAQRAGLAGPQAHHHRRQQRGHGVSLRWGGLMFLTMNRPQTSWGRPH